MKLLECQKDNWVYSKTTPEWVGYITREPHNGDLLIVWMHTDDNSSYTEEFAKSFMYNEEVCTFQPDFSTRSK